MSRVRGNRGQVNESKRDAPGRVLVLGHDCLSFLSVVRSLGRSGLEVHVAWCPEDSPARASRYIARAHDVASPEAPPDVALKALTELIEREDFALVIPTNEQTMRPLQQHRALLTDGAPIYLLNDRAFGIAYDKQRTHELAFSVGVPVPRQVVVENVNALSAAAETLGWPLVLKPISSYAPDGRPGQRRNVKKAYSSEELAAITAEMDLDDEPVLAQEHVHGRGVGVEVLAADGEILFAFQHERVHEPLRGGASSYRRSVPVDEALRSASAKLVRALDYTGVAMVEFRVDPADSARFYLMEINARFWGSLPLALAAGADFPKYLFDLLVHGRRDFPADYEEGIYCRNLIGDMKWFAQNVRADHGDSTLATKPVGESVLELANIARGRERSDTWALDDIRPAVAELHYYAERTLDSARERIARSLIRRPALASRAHDGALAKLREADRLLFVCKGNICRSPFAALYAQRLWPERECRSSGFLPEPGRLSPTAACVAARRHGVDLEAHRSRVIDAAEIERADIVLVFDEIGFRVLASRFSRQADKIFRLGSLRSGTPEEVLDPFGESAKRFDRCYVSIAHLLQFEGTE